MVLFLYVNKTFDEIQYPFLIFTCSEIQTHLAKRCCPAQW